MVISKIYWLLLKFFCRLVIPKVQVANMALHPKGEYISDQIRDQSLHYEIENLLKVAFLCDSSHFLDVGANLGNHSNFFSQFGSKGVAFEPQSKNFALLSKNAFGFQVFRFALGSENSEVNLRYYPTSLGNSHISTARREIEGSTSEFETVQVKRLDDLGINPTQFTLIKIDVEGFELRVLLGGEYFFTNTPATLWLEVHKESNLQSAQIGYTRSAIIDQLKAFGYKCWFRLDGSNFLFSKTKRLMWPNLRHFPVNS